MLRPRRRLNVCCALNCVFWWATAYAYPGSNLLLPRGAYLPVVDHPRDNSRGRSEVRPLYPLGVPPVNEKHDGDHEDRQTIGKIRLQTQAVRRCFQSGEARGSAYGVPNDFR